MAGATRRDACARSHGRPNSVTRRLVFPIPTVRHSASWLDLARRVMRRDVVFICLVIFCADVWSGILSPTFSAHARSLGASLAMIGLLGSVGGLTQILAGMPIGLASEATGRKRMLTWGMLLLAAAAAVYSVAPRAVFLLPGRVLSGLGMVCVYTLGTAYVSDITAPDERGLAFGLYTTSMGLGFAIGPLLGAAVASRFGLPGSYLFGASVAAAGALLAAKTLKGIRPRQRVAGLSAWETRKDILPLLRNRGLMAGALGSLLMSSTFAGVVAGFFPLYARTLLVPQAVINGMFSVRAFGSSLARLPSGTLATRVPSRLVVMGALLLSMLAVFGMSNTSDARSLALFLLLEGIAFGMYLPAGQVFVSQNCSPATRGGAVALYSTAGSVGGTLSPLILGLVAEVWGIRAVFRLTAVCILLGVAWMTWWHARSTIAPAPVEGSAGQAGD